MADFHIVAVNDDACTFLRLGKEALLVPVALSARPDVVELFGLFHSLVAVATSGTPLTLRHVPLPAPGTEAWHEFDVRLAPVEGWLVVSWRDESERAAAIRELRADRDRFQLIGRHASDAVLLSDGAGAITYATDGLQSTFGWLPDAVIGTSIFDLLHPDDVATSADRLARIGAGLPETLHGRVRTGSGQYRWVSARVTPLVDEYGHTSIVSGWRDVHEQELATQALAEANRHLDLLVEHSSSVVAAGDNDGVIRWISSSVQQFAGWSPDQLVGTAFVDLVHPGDRWRVLAVQEQVSSGQGAILDVRIRTVADNFVWASIRVRPQFDDDGAVVGRITGWRELHVEEVLNAAAYLAGEKLHAAVNSARIGLAILDGQRRFVTVNPALCQLLDHPAEWFVRRSLDDVIDPDDHQSDILMWAELVGSGAPTASAERCLITRSGAELWVELVMAVVRDMDGVPVSYICQFIDVATRAEGRMGVAAESA